METRPALSVVVAVVSDTTEARADGRHLAGCLDALAGQVDAPPFEIIVPWHDGIDGQEDLRLRHPDVTFLSVGDRLTRRPGSREHHDVLRALGLQAAQGEVVALIEDHGRPAPDWCANLLRAHQDPIAAAGGAIENGIDRWLNWAVYFCDYGRYQNPLPAGEASFASDSNVSYKRAALEAVRTSWDPSFREVVVNGALLARGDRLVLRPDVVVYQHRSDLSLGPALKERFIWGKSYAVTRNLLLSPGRRLAYGLLSPLLPIVLLIRMGRTAWQRRRNFDRFLTASPTIALLLLSWSAGESVGYFSARRAGVDD